MGIGNIYVIGMMGTGKTTIGKPLAEHLNYQFIDLDAYIENKQGRKISDIFTLEGEEYFREVETEALMEVSSQLHTNSRPVIVATGGGAFEKETNRQLMRDSGKVVWLKTSTQEIAKRLANDTSRPLLHSDGQINIVQRITNLLQIREQNYKLADVHVITDGKTCVQVIEEITQNIF